MKLRIDRLFGGVAIVMIWKLIVRFLLRHDNALINTDAKRRDNLYFKSKPRISERQGLNFLHYDKRSDREKTCAFPSLRSNR